MITWRFPVAGLVTVVAMIGLLHGSRQCFAQTFLPLLLAGVMCWISPHEPTRRVGPRRRDLAATRAGTAPRL